MARGKRWMERVTSFVAAALVAAIPFGLAKGGGLLDTIELKSQDARVNALPPRVATAKVVVVGLGDRSLAEWPEPKAMWTARIARLLDRIGECNPKWIGVDMTFAADIDGYFVDQGLADPAVDRQLRSAIVRQRKRLTLVRVYRAKEEGRSIDRLRLPVASLGNEAFADLPYDRDGVVRYVPISFGRGPDRTYSLSAAIAGRVSGRSPEQYAQGGGHYGLDYRRRPIVSVDAVEVTRPGPIPETVRSRLSGATVLIGSTYSTSSDYWPTPQGDRIHGVFLHALGVSTLLDGTPLAPAPMPSGWLLIALLAVAFLCIPSFAVLPAALLISGIWWAWALRQMDGGGLIWPCAEPIAAALLTAIGVYGIRFWEETRRRRKIEAVFGASVSPEVRNLLLNDPDALRLGGRQIEATVMFVDLRSSVARAFERGPERMIDDLNVLFAAIVPAVHHHRGLLVQFTGDGFVAAFGVPYPTEHHAQQAVEAGREMMHRLEELNNTGGQPPFHIGCGVHTGPIVYGNVGVEGRSEFTLIGDTVNVAARIESLTKVVGHPFLVSEATLALMEDRIGVGDMIQKSIPGRNDVTLLYPITVDSK